MDKNLLIRLLTLNSKVILPGFGAFLHKSSDNRSVFTPFLKSDDGFLSAEVAKEYSVDESDAKEIVSEFVEHIKSTLKNTGKFYFEGIGTLQTDINDTIVFIMDISKQIPGDAQAVTEETPNAQKAQPDDEESAPTPNVQPSSEANTHPAAQPVTPKPLHQTINQQTTNQQQVTPQPINGGRVQFPSSAANQGQPQGQKENRPFSPQPQPQQPRPFRPGQPIQRQPMQPLQPPRPINQNNGVGGVAPRPIQNPNTGRMTPQQMVEQQGGRAPQPQPVQPTPAQPVQKPQQPQQGNTNNVQQPNSQNQGRATGTRLPRTPEPPRKKKKGDVWLLIAIAAAAIVIILMIIGISTAQEIDVMQS